MTTATATALYRYALRYRPATACRLPAGWTLVETGYGNEYPGRPDLPTGTTRFGVVAWDRPLTRDERDDYELTPV